jgi:hypothetical protein
MSNPGQFNRPQAGNPVNKLWRDVDDLGRFTRQLEAKVAAIDRRTTPRKRMDVDGTGGNSQFRGEYLSTAVYFVGDLVIIASGANAGTYICVADNPGAGHAPWAGGGYWVKFFSGNALGQWM